MKILKVILLIIPPLLIFFLFIAVGIYSLNNDIGDYYSPTEEESTYLIAKSVYKGEGFYSDFSIVYPPGRFLALSAFFHILSPSIPTVRLYFHLFAPFIFVSALFYLAYIISGHLFSKNKFSFIQRYVFAIIPPLVYQLVVNSVQEIHAISTIFMIVLLMKFKSKKLHTLILGFLLGCIFAFRVDAGIILLLTLIFNYLYLSKGFGKIKKTFTEYTPGIIGFGIVWIPIILLLIFNGSLSNFFHDLFYMGLIVQPKVMSLPIPPAPIGLVFLSTLIFLLAGSVSLFIYAQQNLKGQYKYAISVFALFSFLSFISALGRSDEGHLWYALAFIPIYIPFLIYAILTIKNFRSFFTSQIIYIPILLFVLAKLILFFKSPAVFLIISLGVFAMSARYIKLLNFRIVIITGAITSILVFHSISYLKLRLILPRISTIYSHSPNFFINDQNEIAGLTYNKTHATVLSNIKKDMSDAKNNYLFIFPDNVLYYEYFKKQNPSRYYYLMGEYTKKTDKDIIDSFNKTQTEYFLFFPKNKVMGSQTILRWILKNTEIKNKYKINEVEIELRKKNY